MKNKKGFVFIETIITIVFLAAALLVLYSSYRNAIVEERKRIYYDDISYLYRNYYIADFLINKTEIHDLKDTAFEEKYAVEIDDNLKKELFSDYQTELNYPTEFETIEDKFNVDKMMFVSEELITECFNAKENDKCNKSYEGLSDGLINYLETMQIDHEEDDNTTYYLVTEYREKSTNEGVKKCEQGDEDCSVFYVTLKLDINKVVNVDKALIGEVCKGQNFADCIKDNYTLENDPESGSGIYHHDGNGTDSGYGEYEANDDSYRYAGGNPNNYICFGSDEEKCPDENLYRIIGVYGSNIKIIKATDGNTKWSGTDTRNISYEDKWNNMLVNSKWYTGGMSKERLDLAAKEIHDAEISGATTNSKTGLMYVNEYMYGASPKYWVEPAKEYTKAKDDNWLFTGNEWMLPKTQGETNQAFVISTEGNVGSNITSQNIMARGSASLKETVILESGIGTKEQPFRITDIGVTITNLSGEVGYFDITVTLTTDAEKEDDILKYFYSYKKSSDDSSKWSEWVETNSRTHKFEGLDSFTDYDIKVKVLNNRGNYSDEKVESFKTLYAGPSIDSFTVISKDSHNVKVRVTASAGTSGIAKYEFSLNGTSWTAVNSNAFTYDYTFSGLNSDTDYTFYVKATDKGDWVSDVASVREKTDYELAKVSLTNVEITTAPRMMEELQVIAHGTPGTASIAKYYYRINGGSWVEKVSSSLTDTKTFTNLTEDTDYKIEAKVLDARGKESNIATLNLKTKPYVRPKVELTSSPLYQSITVSAKTTKGTGDIQKYEFYKDGTLYSSCTKETSATSVTCTFTGLTDNQSYNIKVVVSDSKKLQATDEERVTTLKIINPSVSLSGSSTYNTISVTASGTKGTGDITKYEFYKDGALYSSCTKTTTNATSATCSFTGLTEDKNYTIRVKLTDSYGRVAEDSETIRTKPIYPPTLKIDSTKSTSNTVTINVSTTKGTGNITKYEFYKDGSLYSGCTQSTSNLSASCTITGLSKLTNYTIKAKVSDGLNRSDEKSTTIRTTDITGPTASLSVTSSTQTSITVRAYGTKGDGNIKQYQFYLGSTLKATYSSSSSYYDYTFSGLSASTYYSLKVVVTDTNNLTDYGTTSTTTPANVPPTVYLYKNSTSTNSVQVRTSVTQGTGRITKYEYYKDGSRVTTVSSSSTSDYYTFTGLSPDTSYTFKVYVYDSNGLYDYDYLTVKTDNNTPPSVSLSVGTKTSSSLSVTAYATRGTGSISKYQFYLDNSLYSTCTKSTTSTSASCTYTGLIANLWYDLKVVVTDSNGLTASAEQSRIYTLEEIKPPSVSLSVSSKGSNSVTVKATTTKGTGSIKRYEYYLDGSYVTSRSSTSTTDTYTFSGLSPKTYYSFKVYVYDSNSEYDYDTASATTDGHADGFFTEGSCKVYYKNGTKVMYGEWDNWEWVDSPRGWYYIYGGCVKTGWINSTASGCTTGWYYCDSSGKMLTGQISVNGKKYYLAKGNGSEGKYNDNYKSLPEGCLYKGWVYDCSNGCSSCMWWGNQNSEGNLATSGTIGCYKINSNSCASYTCGGSAPSSSGTKTYTCSCTCHSSNYYLNTTRTFYQATSCMSACAYAYSGGFGQGSCW